MLDVTNSGILVLSDIHACAGDATSSAAESYVSTSGLKHVGTLDPFDDLERILAEYKGKICAVISPGDLTNKAHEQGVRYVWDRLNKIRTLLNAPVVIATPGNHDLDSRFSQNDFDARGSAMLVNPPMPNGLRQNYLEFWAEHFTVFDQIGARFVALNSAAYHGSGKNPQAEMEHGRISVPTLEMLKARLTGLPPSVNFLICHHHPIAHDEIADADYSAIDGGGRLLKLLGDCNIGPWIIVHGHKHRPRLFYSPGRASSPVILGAASFSAQINRDAQNKSPNQFHIIELNHSGAKAIGSDLAGRVKSWNWTVGEGWKPATGSFGLPSECGFGYRNGADPLKDKIIDKLKGHPFLSWATLSALLPEILYLLPDDEKTLMGALRNASVHILEEFGRPAQFSYPKGTQ